MIRPGTPDDIGDVVRMSEEFWQHSQFKHEPFDPEHVAIMAGHCIEQGLMVVLDTDGGVHGFCCGVAGPLLASGSVLAGSEIAWWVDPGYRKGRNGVGLLIAIEEAAKKIGCKYWTMVYMETSMPDEIRSIYERMGYNHGETTHTKRLF